MDIKYIHIDNFNPDKEPSVDEWGAHDIGGDNTWWEFSGWQRGIRYLADTLRCRPDMVVCVNDAFLNQADQGRDIRHFRRAFSPAVLAKAQDSLVGSRFVAAPRCEFDGEDVSTWIQTNFFALPFDFAAKRLGPCLSEAQAEEIFDEHWCGRIFRPNSLCNPALENLLTDWITKNWDRAATPTPENWPLLRMKLIAILNERLLCLAAQKAGIAPKNVSGIRWWQIPK